MKDIYLAVRGDAFFSNSSTYFTGAAFGGERSSAQCKDIGFRAVLLFRAPRKETER